LGKVGLYINTIKHLKASQVFYRVWRKVGRRTPLKRWHVPQTNMKTMPSPVKFAMPELDFDSAFLARFDPDELFEGQISLLNHTESIDWASCWRERLSTPLWQYNLHYFEYLLPLADQYINSGDKRYLLKAKELILLWIINNPRDEAGAAWDSYTISMRVANWLAFIGELSDDLQDDHEFLEQVNDSLALQYFHLSQYLEKDLLANHYLENLKALVLLSIYFNDKKTLNLALKELKRQVHEQILPDGMHFELSPMYHKIVLEDLLRVAFALRNSGFDYEWLMPVLQNMADCLYSLEHYAGRTPLFNDSGDNIAKSKDALLESLLARFGIVPVYKDCFPDAGYYLFEKESGGHIIKIIVDAGKAGPKYALGHAHCDALSFEAFVDDEPWIVNCGTYAYQDKNRLWYKSAEAHSTVMVEGSDQHECWAPFRVARCGKATLEQRNSCSIQASFVNYKGERVRRTLRILEQGLEIVDEGECDADIVSTFYFCNSVKDAEWGLWYSPAFGQEGELYRLIRRGQQRLCTFINFDGRGEDVE